MTGKVLDLEPVAETTYHDTIYDALVHQYSKDNPEWIDPAVAIKTILNEIDYKLMLFFQEMNNLKWKYIGNDTKDKRNRAALLKEVYEKRIS